MSALGINVAIAAVGWIAITLTLWAATFMLFVTVSKLREMRSDGALDELHWAARGIGWALLALGLVLDALLNYIGLTVLFWEAPDFIGEPLCTPRIKRHKYHSTGWRRDRAVYLCRHWLTPVDKQHCEE